MNTIGQLFTPKTWNKPRAPVASRSCPKSESTPEASTNRCSWSTTMLSRVRECRDLIKNMIKFDKTPITSNRADARRREALLVTPRKIRASSPDIVTSNRITFGKSKEEPIVRYSKLNAYADDSLKHGHSVGTFYTEKNDMRVYDWQNYTEKDQRDDSLLSFLALEKQIEEEFSQEKKQEYTASWWTSNDRKAESLAENFPAIESETGGRNSRDASKGAGDVSSTRRKISAEPFLSRSLKSTEMVWEEDSDESLPEKVWNYLDLNTSEDLNMSEDLNRFDVPYRNSTFCEEIIASEPSGIFRDSGFENNISIFSETV